MRTEQLQIRISSADKRRLKRAAARFGLGISEFVLKRALNGILEYEAISKLCKSLDDQPEEKFVFAELHDLLASYPKDTLEYLAENSWPLPDNLWAKNYIAAMFEEILVKNEVDIPDWLQEIPVLSEPWFATELKSLKNYLLLSSPIAFRKRNLFIDSTVGARV